MAEADGDTLLPQLVKERKEHDCRSCAR
jgi:hypothetical protein